jgi:hypothetical protein
MELDDDNVSITTMFSYCAQVWLQENRRGTKKAAASPVAKHRRFHHKGKITWRTAADILQYPHNVGHGFWA